NGGSQNACPDAELIGSFLLPVRTARMPRRRFLYYFSVYVNPFKELFLSVPTEQAVRLVS
ncbi:hypothetical protein, partial [Prevotella multiformis]|uniref:hypothetical protein n=1 Tax=Prevotella multiformis TaxID=282402 RepID=UPI00058D7AEB